MDAVFKKKYFWNIVCLLCGLFLMGLFLFIYFVDSEATGEVWPGVILGGVICACSIFSLFHNFKAYLHIDAEHIKGRYNWFGKIDCTLSDVFYAQFQMNTLTILLKNGKQHIISGIENPLIPCAVLRRMMPFTVCRDIEKAKEELHQMQKERRTVLFRVILCIALMFAYIFLTVFLTGSRELYEFGNQSETAWRFRLADSISCNASSWIRRTQIRLIQPIRRCRIPTGNFWTRPRSWRLPC